MDASTTLEQLRRTVIGFRDERNWKQFHDPKNLAIGLAVEAAELQELFLWKSDTEVRDLVASERGERRLGEEIADIFIFLLYLSDACGIDLSDALHRKLHINARKYPVGEYWGSNRKYDESNGGNESAG